MLAWIMSTGNAYVQAQQPVNESKSQQQSSFRSNGLWYDTRGELMNVHGGGMLYQDNTWYWFGEKRGQSQSEGVNVYSLKTCTIGNM